jgi:hypothetical protein
MLVNRTPGKWVWCVQNFRASWHCTVTQQTDNRKAVAAVGGKYEPAHLQVRDPTDAGRRANGRSGGKARIIYDLQPVGRHQVTTVSKLTELLLALVVVGTRYPTRTLLRRHKFWNLEDKKWLTAFYWYMFLVKISSVFKTSVCNSMQMNFLRV